VRLRAEGTQGRARSTARARTGAFAVLALALFLAGCRQDMHDQPKVRTYRGSSLFADGRACDRWSPERSRAGNSTRTWH